MQALKDLITEFHVLKTLYLESAEQYDVTQCDMIMLRMELVAADIDKAAEEREVS